MTGHDQVWGGDFIGEAQGFVFHDIKTGPGETVLAACGQERRLLHDVLACAVDQKRGGFHPGNFAGTDHAAGLGREGTVNRQYIRHREEFVKGSGPFNAVPCRWP